MATLVDQIRDLAHDLGRLPGDLKVFQGYRDRALMGLPESGKDLLARSEHWESVHQALEELAVVLNNCRPTLDKLARQAAKDKATLREFEKKAGRGTFDRKHPIYTAQRVALELAAKRAEFPKDDFANLLSELERNRSARGVPELVKLFNRLVDLSEGINDHLRIVAKDLRALQNHQP